MPDIETLFFQAFSQGHGSWIILLAFMGGVVSSILPCTLGMMPILVGYIGGYGGQSKGEVFWQATLFIAGVALVMTALGVAASILGLTFGAWLGSGWYYLIGVLILLLGVHMLGWFHIPFPQWVHQLPDLSNHEHPVLRQLAPMLLGMAFGITASPCGTPYLAAILSLISQEQNLLLGAVSLFAYAMGQGVLLILIGLFTGLLKHLAAMRRLGRVFHHMSGVLMVLAGLILIAQGADWFGIFAP